MLGATIDDAARSPVVLVSGHDDWTEEEIAASGIHACILKPFGAEQLGELIHWALGDN